MSTKIDVALDLPTMVAAYIHLGEEQYAATSGDSEWTGYTAARDDLREAAEKAHTVHAFANEYKRQRGMD